MKKIFFMVIAALILSSAPTFAEGVGNGKKIIYIPIDNRPINYNQTFDVAKRLGYEVLMPPENLLGTGASADKFGKPAELWQWLFDNAPQANAAVISTDAMLYGSLVGSRQHILSNEEVLARAQNFQILHEKNPALPLYTFATIMRTPRVGSNSGTEPEYYQTYAPAIFNYTALVDKSETHKISRAEQKEIAALKNNIPAEYLEDWLGRRNKNFDALKLFVDLTKADVFKYFLVGCDDNAIFSQTHLESRHLTEYAKPLGRELFQVMSGADELGMLMIARAVNNDLHNMPFVAIEYNVGTGADTIPNYSYEPISESLDGAIYSIGGVRISNPARADLVLAVNTLPNGKTFYADNKRNKPKPHTGTGPYMQIVKGNVRENYPVGVIDIAYVNGSDNALMKRLRNEKLEFKIRSYGGWNTATNSAGFLIGSGTLTKFMGDKDIYELLLARYFDEWAYQANIRKEINDKLIWTIPGEGGLWNLGTRREGLEKLTSDLMTEFARKNFRLPRGYSLKNIQVSFPWSRTFEAKISFDLEQN